jgi:cytochrome b561
VSLPSNTYTNYIAKRNSVLICHIQVTVIGWFMVFNATFNNISAISWQSVEETAVLRKNLSKVTYKLYHIMLYRVHLAMNSQNWSHMWNTPSEWIKIGWIQQTAFKTGNFIFWPFKDTGYILHVLLVRAVVVMIIW